MTLCQRMPSVSARGLRQPEVPHAHVLMATTGSEKSHQTVSWIGEAWDMESHWFLISAIVCWSISRRPTSPWDGICELRIDLQQLACQGLCCEISLISLCFLTSFGAFVLHGIPSKRELAHQRSSVGTRSGQEGEESLLLLFLSPFLEPYIIGSPAPYS